MSWQFSSVTPGVVNSKCISALHSDTVIMSSNITG